MAALISGADSPGLLAGSWRAQQFLESLRGSPYDFDFLRRGIAATKWIKPGSHVSYSSEKDLLILPTELFDESGMLKAIDEVDDPIAIDGLFHEAFHAYKAHFIDRRQSLRPLKEWFQGRSDTLFSQPGVVVDEAEAHYPLKRGHKEYALEEAYAVYIGSVAAQLKNITNYLQKNVDDERCDQRMSTAKRLWGHLRREKPKGYFRRTWFEEFTNGTILSAIAKALLNEEDTIYVSIPIVALDKFWIEENILAKKLVWAPFEDVFHEELSNNPYCRYSGDAES